MGALRIAGRGGALALLLTAGLAILLALRLIERPIFGPRRPWTPSITRGVCRGALFCLGLRRRERGTPMTMPGGAVANHASWLDIFALNAGQTVTFVAKAEVAGWAGIGWLARATGTLFVARERRAARSQAAQVAERLRAGQHLLFFPEGTSTDGLRVLPFKSTLFGAFFAEEAGAPLHVQPITIRYRAPAHAAPSIYGWWGDAAFGPHLATVLGLSPQGAVDVIYHPPVAVADHADRKSLAQACEDRVREGFDTGAPAGAAGRAQPVAGRQPEPGGSLPGR